MKKAVLVTAGAVLLAGGVGGGMSGMQRGKSGTPPPPGMMPQAQAASRPTTVPAAAVAFNNGTLVHLMALTEVSPAPAPNLLAKLVGAVAPTTAPAAWWAPDGSAVPPVALSRLGNVSAGSAAGRREVRFIFSMHTPRPPARGVEPDGLAIQIDGVTSSSQSSSMMNNDRLINHVGSLPQDLLRTQVRVGVSSGRWREIASKPVVAAGVTRPSETAIFGEVSETDGKCAVEIDSRRVPQGDWRVEAVLRDGRRVRSNEYQGFGGGKGQAKFSCRKDEVARIVGSSRPYQWKTLGDVALVPLPSAAITGTIP